MLLNKYSCLLMCTVFSLSFFCLGFLQADNKEQVKSNHVIKKVARAKSIRGINFGPDSTTNATINFGPGPGNVSVVGPLWSYALRHKNEVVSHK